MQKMIDMAVIYLWRLITFGSKTFVPSGHSLCFLLVVCTTVYGSTYPLFDNHTFLLLKSMGPKAISLENQIKTKVSQLTCVVGGGSGRTRRESHFFASFSSLLSIPTAYGGEYTAEEQSRETTISKL